jgi:hypothetical protein
MDERELAAKARAELNQLMSSHGHESSVLASAYASRQWSYRCMDQEIPLSSLKKLDINV